MPERILKIGYELKVLFLLLGMALCLVPGSFGRDGIKLYSRANNLAWNSAGTWSLTAHGAATQLIPQANDTIVIDCIIIKNVNFTFCDQGQLVIVNTGFLKGDNLDLGFSGNSKLLCSGELKTGSLSFVQNSLFNIEESGVVAVNSFFSNSSYGIQTVSGKINVSGSISAESFSSIIGNGTIEAMHYAGSGYLFGFSPASIVPDGSIISQNNWRGTVSKNWNDPLNWLNGTVPAENSNISILASSFNPDFIGKATYNNLYINSQAIMSVLPAAVLEISSALTVKGIGKLLLKNTVSEKSSLLLNGSVDGYVQSEYPVIAGKNNLVSSPVSSAVSGTFLSMYLREYDEPASQWGNYIIPTEDPLQVMRGYEVYSLFSETRVFEGTPNQNSKSFEVSNSGNGLNLTGNPFLSYIDWENNENNLWDRNSVAAAIYYPDPSGSGNFSVYMPGGDNAVSINNASRYIPPMQGFFVKAIQQGLFMINENSRVKVYSDSRVLLKNNSIKFKLNDSNGLTDEAMFRIIPASTFQFDDNFDALKLQGNTNAPSIHIESDDNIKYAISTIPTLNSSLDILLNIECSSSGMYSLSSTGSFNFEYRYPVILEDKELNKFIDMRMDSVYSFYHTPEMNSQRFEIHFNSPDGVNESTDNFPAITISKRKVSINGDDNNTVYSANLYSIDGKLISTVRGFLAEGIVLETPNLPSGICILHLNNGTQTMTKKIIIQ